MATISIDFPTFLPSEVMPERDALKYSSTFLRSDGIDTVIKLFGRPRLFV